MMISVMIVMQIVNYWWEGAQSNEDTRHIPVLTLLRVHEAPPAVTRLQTRLISSSSPQIPLHKSRQAGNPMIPTRGLPLRDPERDQAQVWPVTRSPGPLLTIIVCIVASDNRNQLNKYEEEPPRWETPDWEYIFLPHHYYQTHSIISISKSGNIFLFFSFWPETVGKVLISYI